MQKDVCGEERVCLERRLPENPLLRGSCLLVRRYLRHRVGMESAALAFYLLFAAFPFLIFSSALIGLLQLDITAVLVGLEGFLPEDVLRLAEMYLRYVEENSSLRLLLFGLVFSVYFPMRAADALVRAARVAYHLGPPRATVWHWVRILVCTLVLMAAMSVTLVLMTVSDRLLNLAVLRFRLPAAAAVLWSALRFPAAAMLGYAALLALYAVAWEGPRPRRAIWPGAVAALAVWMLGSWGYKWYAEQIADYSVLYGSIGAVIVLLMWLYVTAVILIMGAEWNGVLLSLRKERAGGMGKS